jgi:hypothetical protein
VTPQVMRHTAITNLVRSGADLPTIRPISGYETLTTVPRYTHVHGSHIDRAVKAIGRGLPDLIRAQDPDAITPGLHRAGSRWARTLEARAGIEPTYGDLQSRSGEFPKRPKKGK